MSNKKQAMDVEKQAKPKRGREDEEEEEDEEEMEAGISKVDLAKEHLKDLPQSVRRRVFALTNLQKRHAELDRQYRDELDALERKYLALHAPLLDRRTAIVTGESEPAEEEAAGYVVDGTAPATEARGVPMFWYHTLVNNDTVNQLTGLNERDKDAIAALQDIRYTPLPRTRDTVDGKEIIRHGFTLAFKFGPNEFFEDSLLTKTYHLTEDDSGEPLFERSEATKPQWKAGKNLTVRVIKKAVPRPKRGGKGGRGAHSGPQFQTVEEPCESFFQFFSPVQMPAEDTEVDPEEFEETTQAVQADFEAGCELRDVVCPRAVAWFTGDAVEEDDEDDFDEEDYDEEDDGEGEDDEDDEEDEDEDEEEEAKPRKGAKPQSHQFAPPPGGKPAGENPECKQQ